MTTASEFKKAHIPDISTQDGLLDIIMLGNMLEFSKVFAGKSRAASEAEEQDVARFRYRRFMAWFADHHLVVLESQMVNPWYLFYRSLIEFGSSLCEYKSVWPESNPGGLSASLLERYVTEHISDQWPSLLPRFQQLRESPTRLFAWSGPAFTIYHRDRLPAHFAATESMDVPECPVFSLRSDTPSPPNADHTAGMSVVGDRAATSTSTHLKDTNSNEAMDAIEEGADNPGENMDISGDELDGNPNHPGDAGENDVAGDAGGGEAGNAGGARGAGDVDNVEEGSLAGPSQPPGKSHISYLIHPHLTYFFAHHRKSNPAAPANADHDAGDIYSSHARTHGLHRTDYIQQTISCNSYMYFVS